MRGEVAYADEARLEVLGQSTTPRSGRFTMVVNRRPAVVTDPAGAEFLTLEWHGDVLVASHGAMFESRTEIGCLDMKSPRKGDQFQLALKDGETVFKEMFIHPAGN